MVRRGVCLLFLIAFTLMSSANARADDLFRPNEVLVRLLPGSNLAAFNLLYGTQLIEQLAGTTVYRLRTPLGVDPEAFSTLLRLDPRVVWAEPDFITGPPETRGGQWTSTFDGGTNPGPYLNQGAFRQVGFKAAAKRSDGSGVTVAILDTGISTRNPYLSGRVLPGWNTLNDSPQTDDAPDFRDNNGNGLVDEGTGHGSMVAGIVAALAAKTPLLPVKVLDSDGVGDLWGLVKGIRWAVDHGADVLNLSLGIAQRSYLLEEVVDETYRRGALVVTSAGNNNTDQPQYPAGVPRVLTVAALNDDNTKASFSNFGWMVDVCAPGVNICSTYWNGRFGIGSGTSFAAPFVTGQVALIWSVAPGLSNYAAQDVVRNTAHSVDDVNPAYRGNLGIGLIDIDRSVLLLSGD